MCFDNLLICLRHVLTVAINYPLVIADRHPFQGLADGNRSDAVVYFYLHHLFAVAEVPPLHYPHLITSHY